MLVPPCLDCGACCFGDSDEYVSVTGDDHERLGEHAERLTQFVGNRCFMKMVDRHGAGHQHCVALQLRAGRFVCKIYEQRPEICRTLERGSPACHAEHQMKAARARQSQPAD